MPRKPYTRKPLIRTKPDSRYGSIELRSFINCLMLHGKYSVASSIVYEALERVAKDVKGPNPTKEEVLEVFKQIIDAAKPVVEVSSKRIGGATYQVPTEVRVKRRVSLAYRWIINFARQRSGSPMADRLYREFSDICNKRGSTLKKREETHKMAEANRAFMVKKSPKVEGVS